MVLEKPDPMKCITGICCCMLSAGVTNFALGPDPDSSGLFWIVPGIVFGLALTIPVVSNMQGFNQKIVSMFGFPLLSLGVWVFNVFLAGTLGSAVSSLSGLAASLMFIGFYSSLTLFGAFNFFYQRKIKLLNYCIVGLCGAGSFFLVHNTYTINGEGMANHLDKLIEFWQILVGISISITYRKENLELFIT